MFRYGPLVQHLTMCYEGKHLYFKHIAFVIENFTNICYSLLLHHQLHQCYLNLNKTGLPRENIELGPGMTFSLIL